MYERGRYLTACANDFCREAKRQTISAQDVMQAIKELEFGELEEPLKEYLDQVWHIHSTVGFGMPMPSELMLRLNGSSLATRLPAGSCSTLFQPLHMLRSTSTYG